MRRIRWMPTACALTLLILVASMPGYSLRISAESVQIWTGKSSYCIEDSAMTYFRADNVTMDYGGGSELDLQLEIWTDKGCGSTYKENDHVTIYYKASRDCYVSLFDVFGGSVSLFKQEQIAGGQTYSASRVLTGAGVHEFVIIAENKEVRCTVHVEEEAPQTGSIMVYVQDESGNAISGAGVYLDGGYKGDTDVRGGFRIDGVPEGNHIVAASKSGYKDSNASAYVAAGKTETVYLKLEKDVKTGTIEVYVTDDSGNGLSEASVHLDNAFKGRTDSNGY
ncbi:MAG: carboxypeptidase regulatory-like domain-containing protein, partial [Theionarchaea archaeon]|nr:carboxypeptidase regulatory-like domain-containing protein [Theionarchaea archaeon]